MPNDHRVLPEAVRYDKTISILLVRLVDEIQSPIHFLGERKPGDEILHVDSFNGQSHFFPPSGGISRFSHPTRFQNLSCP